LDVRHGSKHGCQCFEVQEGMAYCHTHGIFFLDVAKWEPIMYEDVQQARTLTYKERVLQLAAASVQAFLECYPGARVEQVVFMGVRKGVRLD
jgi:hypothetical protein